MKKNTLPSITALVISTFLCSHESQATLITYSDEATFLAAVGSPSMESFEGLAATNALAVNSFSLADFTVEAFGGGNELGVWNVPTSGLFATDGTQYVRKAAASILRFTFATPIEQFGINITDWGDGALTGLTLDFANENGDSATIATAPLPNANLLFFGVTNIGTPFTSVDISHANDTFGFDEVYYGSPSPSAVPEPSSYALVGLALLVGGVGYARRKQSNGST